MRATRALAAAALAWALAAPSTAQQMMLEVASEAAPATGVDSHAGVGEPIYSEQRKTMRVAARTLSSIVVTKRGGRIDRGAELPGEYIDGRRVFCAHAFTVPGFAYLCLTDTNGDGRFDALVQKRFKPPPGLVVDVPFERVLRPLPEPMAADAFRAELVYHGAGGGVLRLLYREYAGDLARPAFTQEATYDLEPDGPTEIVFKGARLAVATAGNTGIEYRVLSGFAH